MGNVQSGKTANMAGLMAMANDNGFNYFIVLSGVIENLRQQTANRLYNDLKYSKVSTIIEWNRIDNPSTRSNDAKDNISNFNLKDNSKERYFTVCLKNKGRLTSLFNWLKSDPNKSETT